VTHGNQVLSRAMVVQRKTQRPPGFDTSPRFSALFGKCLQRRSGFDGRDRESAVVARL